MSFKENVGIAILQEGKCKLKVSCPSQTCSSLASQVGEWQMATLSMSWKHKKHRESMR